MKWVNATERLPKEYGSYFCIDLKYNHKCILWFRDHYKSHLWAQPERYKWLDETTLKT